MFFCACLTTFSYAQGGSSVTFVLKPSIKCEIPCPELATTLTINQFRHNLNLSFSSPDRIVRFNSVKIVKVDGSGRHIILPNVYRVAQSPFIYDLNQYSLPSGTYRLIMSVGNSFEAVDFAFHMR